MTGSNRGTGDRVKDKGSSNMDIDNSDTTDGVRCMNESRKITACIHSLVLVHTLIQSRHHTFTLTHSLTHSLYTHSLTHSLNHSITYHESCRDSMQPRATKVLQNKRSAKLVHLVHQPILHSLCVQHRLTSRASPALI